MRLDISKFGTLLLSRPEGREAFLAARAYSIPKDTNEKVELDFSKVDVLTPSWADEFIGGLRQEFGSERISILPTENSSIKLSIQAVES